MLRQVLRDFLPALKAAIAARRAQRAHRKAADPASRANRRIVAQLDPHGFNELKLFRSGPLLYNKFDTYIGEALSRYGEYSFGEQVLFQRLVRSGSTVVEVGANIGVHTVELSRLVGGNGTVYAFEPQRLVFQALCANLALNQCTNVLARQAALGSEDGTILVPAMDPATRTNFGGISLQGATVGESVPVIALDRLSLAACHFLKADVEGMELDVVTGAVETIRRHRPLLYLENDRQDRSKALIELVMSLGYDLYWHLPPIYNPQNFAGDAQNLFPNVVSVNLLCVPAEAQIPIQGMRKVSSPSDWWQGRPAQ